MVTTSKLSVATTALAAFYLASYFYNRRIGPTVQISNGKLRGLLSVSRGGKEFVEFLGIPFAKPPVGPLRFELPQPAENWPGVFDAFRNGEICMQIDNFLKTVKGTEDCLKLNVFAPKTKNGGFSKTPLPVMAYIHGGYFMAGETSFHRPEYLLDEPVVLVVMSYRVASLGFLNSGDGVVMGNMGLKDQVLALKWIQENIGVFGGDPNRVTIFGESAGASAVHYHMLSPMSKGLFHKAITESGSAIKLWSIANYPMEQALRLGKLLNCPTTTTKAMVECLKNMDAKRIIGIHRETVTPLLHPLHMFGPTIESAVGVNATESDKFLPEHPYEILTKGKGHRIPLLTGVNADEGLLISGRIFYDNEMVTQLENNWDDLSPKFLVYDKKRKDWTAQIRQFYFGTENTQGKLDFNKHFANFTNLFSDRLYIYPSRQTALVQSQFSPVYLYFYNYRNHKTLAYFMTIKARFHLMTEIILRLIFDWFREKLFGWKLPYLGICHGDELVMLFKLPLVEVEVNSPDYQMSRQLVKLWVQFVYDDTKLAVNETKWLPLGSKVNATDGKGLKYMLFSNAERGKLIDEPFLERMQFWEKLNLPWIDGRHENADSEDSER